MSNLETEPAELVSETPAAAPAVLVLEPRDVPLGGPRAMRVRCTLPQRARSLIGPWCFVDHYGPDDVSRAEGMVVPPHPHTGLQAVSWLFAGEIQHRDSTGVHQVVRPGELNLMTAGRGIQHSELSTPETTVLHGAQLWIALPDSARGGVPRFEHYVPPAVSAAGATLRVFLGELAGERSPVETATPLLGGEPFRERIVMWWNFVGRSHEEIVASRATWQTEVIGEANPAGRFGRIARYPGPALPAPELPNVRLRPRE